jgi:DNA (cytosine-5)-methyltransferase 3A
MKVLSLFDGISIAQQALKELNIPVETYYASEIDKYAISLTQKNFPRTIQLGDVTKLGKENPYPKELLEGVDLIVFGSPCTNLSIAKKNREGLAGSESKLFFEAVRIIKDLKPKYFLMENVNSMSLESKAAITMELFNIPPVMINASLVSGQSRKRLFWVGRLVNGQYEQVQIDQPEDRNIFLKDLIHENRGEEFDLDKYIIKTTFYREKGLDYKFHNIVIDKNNNDKLKSNTLKTGGRGSGINDKHNWDTIRVASIGKGGQGDRIYSVEGKSVTLSANGGGRGAKTGLYRIEGKYDRKITPIECCRLQSLPDDYLNVDGISNTQKYKVLGNGFNCEVIKHILKNIL